MSNARNLSKLLGTDTQITTPDIADGVFQANKNLIINGAMTVAQRGTSVASSSGSVVRCVDRHRCFARGAGAATFSQTSTVPTGQGFANSLRADVTTVDSSLDSNDLYMIDQRLEGQDLQQLAKGTSDAKSITASFWVRSTKTGTYILTLFDDDNDRFIAKSYSISSADTWEYKTITFEGDTTGALDNDNNASFTLRWFLAAGTSYTSGTLATSWGAGVTANQAVGQTNFFDSNSNDFYITGIQLEVGDTATPFEHRSFGDELARCQRYYQVTQNFMGNAHSVSGVVGMVSLSGEMRANPAFSQNGVFKVTDGYTSDFVQSSTGGALYATKISNGYMLYLQNITGLTAGRSYHARCADTNVLIFDAEI